MRDEKKMYCDVRKSADEEGEKMSAKARNDTGDEGDGNRSYLEANGFKF